MAQLVFFRNWWVLLLQGIFMIALSIIIINNPEAVLATLSMWFGVIIIIIGLVAIVSWISSSKNQRDIFSLFGGIFIVILGILMISKIFITIKAITLIFSLLVSIIGLLLISGSWSGRKEWKFWWVVALLGFLASFIGIKSAMDTYAGAKNISNLIGISIFISGIGLIVRAFMRKKILNNIKNKLQQ